MGEGISVVLKLSFSSSSRVVHHNQSSEIGTPGCVLCSLLALMLPSPQITAQSWFNKEETQIKGVAVYSHCSRIHLVFREKIIYAIYLEIVAAFRA